MTLAAGASVDSVIEGTETAAAAAASVEKRAGKLWKGAGQAKAKAKAKAKAETKAEAKAKAKAKVDDAEDRKTMDPVAMTLAAGASVDSVIEGTETAAAAAAASVDKRAGKLW